MNIITDYAVFTPITNNVFSPSNKIRKAWVHMLRGSMVDVMLQSYPAEDRFDIYAEIDSDVREEYTRRLRVHNDKGHKNGWYSDIVVIGRPVMKAEHQIKNLDDVLVAAVETVVARLEEEFKFHQNAQ